MRRLSPVAQLSFLALVVGCRGGGDAEGKAACCASCRSNRTCRVAVWQQSTAKCFTDGRYAFAGEGQKKRDFQLACLTMRGKWASHHCKYLPARDYQATYAVTLRNTRSEGECCAACLAWESCRVGLWHGGWRECYLKGGFVRPIGKPQKAVMACEARANPELAAEFDCSQPGADCRGRVGAAHWGPCYSVNKSLPSLLDGARSVLAMGSRVIKVALFKPRRNYPLNSPAWPQKRVAATPEALAKHRYFRELWSMNFTSYVLVVYSTVGSSIDYWRGGISERQEEEETRQLHAVASFLLWEYPDKTFVLQNSEGDWASRGAEHATRPAAPGALYSMSRWLRARQAGVTKARNEVRRRDAKGNVYLAVELNLVVESVHAAVPCVLDRVLPEVEVDMVSYSAYDTQQVLPDFKEALALILARHRRTSASPPGARALLVGEFGLPQSSAPATDVRRVVGDVVNSALAFGASFVLFWEVFCNECRSRGKGGCGKDGRCRDASAPVDDPRELRGFWLVRPDGSFSWPRDYLAAKLSGVPEKELWRMRTEQPSTEVHEFAALEHDLRRGDSLLKEMAVGAFAVTVLVPMSILACWCQSRGKRRAPVKEDIRYAPVSTTVGAVGEEDPFAIQ